MVSAPSPTRRLFALGNILAFLIAGPAGAVFSAPALVSDPSATIFINEIHYDNTGTDAGEAIEIAGPAGTDLTGWSIVLYNGSGGASYDTDVLSGVIPDQQDGFGTLTLSYPSNGIQNGAPDGIALVDSSSIVVQFLSYEGSFTAVGGPANGLVSTDIGVSETGSEPVGQSLQLTGTGSMYGDFIWSSPMANTFGAVNTGQTFTSEPPASEPVIADCGAPLSTVEGTAATTTVSASDADGTVVDIAITSVTPSPAPGTISLSGLVPAGGVGGTATADVTVDALTPVGSYSVLITATNDDPTSQTGTCTLTITVNPPPTPIYSIQGDGAASPLVGTQQTTTGVVTVILSSGFFMQDPLGDGNPATSDGIFVFSGSTVARTLAPGDEVTVTGMVTEFRSSTRPRDLTLTELSTPVTVVKTGSGAPLPVPALISDRPDTEIDPDGINAFEVLEGMFVEIAIPTVSGPTNSFGEFLVVASGDAGNATDAGNMLVESLGQDDVDYNPERIMVDDEARLPGGTGSGVRINDPQVQVVVGDTATGNIIGALDYQFSNYRVQASHLLSDVIAGSTPESPIGGLRPAEPYEGRIATFNVENLFDCVDAPDKDDEHPSCTATDLADLETQLAKLVLAFEQELSSPDIVIVEETENAEVLTGDPDGFVPGTTIPALLPRLSGNYDATSFDASDERGIEVGFIFNTDRATLNDAFLSTDILPDSEGVFNGDAFGPGREPLVGFFTLDDIGLIVVGNHLKSKGGPQFTGDPLGDNGDDPLYGGFQPPTRWTETLRHKQADYLRDLVDLLLAQNPDANLMVGGDLNDFQFAEPGEGLDTVTRIKDSPTDPLTNVIDFVPADSRYTFIFEGNSQVLDHMLLNAGMEALRRDQGIAHFNASFPVTFEDDATVTLRASDHDPLSAYFCTDATPPSLAASVSPDRLWPPDHRYRTVNAAVTVSDNADPNPVLRLISVTSNEPDDGQKDGHTVNDIVIVDDFTFRLRAERSGIGTGRIYTITYEATDACGNSTVGTATVTVPLR